MRAEEMIMGNLFAKGDMIMVQGVNQNVEMSKFLGLSWANEFHSKVLVIPPAPVTGGKTLVAAGVKEGDELIISLNDGITLTPAKKFNREAFEKAAEIHKKEIFELKEALSPQPREVSGFSLEDEFD